MQPRERAADEEGRGQPGDDRQDVEGEELGVLVGVADAGRDAARAVDQLVLVELVAERDRQQEQPAEDGEVDADRRREDEPAARRADEVADEDDDQRRDDEAVEQALDQAQERQLEQEEADVAAEDRVVTAVAPAGENGTWFAQSRTVSQAAPSEPPMVRAMNDRDDRQGHAGERRQVGHVVGLEGDRPRGSPNPRGRTAARSRGRSAWAASLSRSNEAAEAAGPSPGGGLSRAASHRFAEQDDQGEDQAADEQADLGPEPRPEDAVEADARVPERVGPQVEPEAEQEMNSDDDRR